MLLGELELDGAQTIDTLGKVDAVVGSLMAGLGKMGGVLAAAFAGFFALDALLSGFGETLNLGGELEDMSAATGQTTSDLVILRQAFENAGLGASQTTDLYAKMQDTIAGVNEEGKSTAKALDALGVSAAELRDMTALQQVERLTEGFSRLEDQTEKVAIARDLFGRSGTKALAVFGDPEALKAAREQAGDLARIMGENSAAFDSMGDVVGALKLNFQEFFAGALSKIAPEATSIAEALGSIDFVGIGEAVGSLMSVFLKLVEVLAMIAPLVNAISEGMGAVFGNTKSAPLAEKYQGFARSQQQEETGEAVVTSLQRIGGGGMGGSGGDAYLTESRRHTQLLERLVEQGRRPGSANFEVVPV